MEYEFQRQVGGVPQQLNEFNGSCREYENAMMKLIALNENDPHSRATSKVYSEFNSNTQAEPAYGSQQQEAIFKDRQKAEEMQFQL